MNQPSISPVVKWVGGKRQLLSAILSYVEKQHIATYIEPFIGGERSYWRCCLKRLSSMITTRN